MSNIIPFKPISKQEAVTINAEGCESMREELDFWKEAKTIIEHLELFVDNSYRNGQISDDYYYSIIESVLIKFCKRLKAISPEIIMYDSDCLQNILQCAVQRILQAQGVR